MARNLPENFPSCQPEQFPIFSIGRFADKREMERPKAANPILSRLDALGAAHDPPLTRYAIAQRAGVNEGTLRKLERNPQASMRGNTIAKLARALSVRTAALLGEVDAEVDTTAAIAPESSADVPLLGAAAGAAVASFIVSSDPIDWLPRPPALRHVKNAYAVYVENDSMEPMHSRGDLRFVDPNKPPRSGDTVIVQTSDAKGNRQAWIKILVKRLDGWVVCRQLNPPAEVRYSAENVASMHRVLTMAELFNR